MRSTKIATAALAGLLTVTLAACGSNNETAPAAPAPSSSTPAAPSATGEPTPTAEIADLSNGVSTAVALDPAFLEALTARTVTPGVLGDATLVGADITFPITGGNVSLFDPATVSPYVTGSIEHTGSGLSLTAGGVQVDLTDFVIDPGTSMLTGTVSSGGAVVAPAGTPLFFLDGSTLQPVQMEGTNAILQGTTVKLAPEAAALLNTTYKLSGDTAFPDYFTIGVATITAATA